MKKLLVIIFIAYAAIANAQTNMDSLFAIWQDHELEDSTRLKAISLIIQPFMMSGNPDSALILAQEMQVLAQKIGNRQLEAQAILERGLITALLGDMDGGIIIMDESLVIYNEIGDDYGRSRVLSNSGYMLFEQGVVKEGLQRSLRALFILDRLGNKFGISRASQTLGSMYREMNEFSPALKHFNRALEIGEEANDSLAIGGSLMNIGLVYRDLDEPQKALEYFERSYNFFIHIHHANGLATVIANLAGIHSDMGAYSKALLANERAKKMFIDGAGNFNFGNILAQRGQIFYRAGNYDSALFYIDSALAQSILTGGVLNQPNLILLKADMAMDNGQYSYAVTQCLEGYEKAIAIQAIDNIIRACHCLYRSYKELGEGQKALDYHEKYLMFTDSLQTKESLKKLQQMEFQKEMLADSIANAEEARFMLEEHEEEVRQKNLTRNYLAGAGLVLLLLAVGFYSRWRYIRKSKNIIEGERDRSDNLLLNILPADIAEELKMHGKAQARDFDIVSILFTDFKGFTEQSAKMSAADLVNEINTCFEAFDRIMAKYGVEKIKTIGDAYMAAGGLPVPTDDSVKNTVLAALEMQDFITARSQQQAASSLPFFEMRVGIHTGPVVAGIVGVKKFQYDIWGDTVNTASRMESSGEVGKVNISQATYELLKDDPEFSFESRGKIEAKGKGEIEMYFIEQAS